MFFSFVLNALSVLIGLFVAILPDWQLPEALSEGLGGFSSFIALVDNILPSGTLTNLFAAAGVILGVNLFLIPLLIARNFKIPFLNR